MALLVPAMIAKSPISSIILDIAPTKSLSALLRGHGESRYISIDFDPTADGRAVDIQASLTALPFRTDSVDFVLCSHVLEHVPDDLDAMKELSRALGPDSVGLIQVPRRAGTSTDEDPAAPVEERLIRFGQADHVRYYGDDFEGRLEDAGLRVATLRYSEALPGPLLGVIGASNDEELWIVTTGADPLEFLDEDLAFRTFAQTLIQASSESSSAHTSRVRDLEARLSEAESQVEIWRSHYEWLKGRPAVRLASAGKRTLNKIASAFEH